jgi:hypothetical protein
VQKLRYEVGHRVKERRKKVRKERRKTLMFSLGSVRRVTCGTTQQNRFALFLSNEIHFNIIFQSTHGPINN